MTQLIIYVKIEALLGMNFNVVQNAVLIIKSVMLTS